MTGLVLAVFAENGGKPGAVLGQGTASGTPAVSSWIKVSGLSVAVTSATKYWLVALPTGSGNSTTTPPSARAARATSRAPPAG